MPHVPHSEVPHMTFADGSDPVDSRFAGIGQAYDAQERATARFSVKGKAAIVTGGLGTLGSECAKALLEHGLAKLALFDTFDKPNTKVDELRRLFPEAEIMYTSVDITNESLATHCVHGVAHRFGRLDILLCFAGIVYCDHALNISADKWRQVQDVNTTGHFTVAREVAKCMIESRQPGQKFCGGSIVFVASVSAHHVNFPQPQAAYNVSKAGVVHMTHCLAMEWAQYGIRVNSISPGYMDTILNEGKALEEARRTWIARTPMGRMGRVDELTGVVVMLCSPAGSYMTGSDIRVDGGMTLF